jgi:hypothetical protein
MYRSELVVALTDIPVAVTFLFIENHAKVDVPRSAAATNSIHSAGINFFMIVSPFVCIVFL